MLIQEAILALYPDLNANPMTPDGPDFEVRGNELYGWYTTKYSKPTIQEIEKGWLLYNAEQKKHEFKQREDEEFNKLYSNVKDFVLDALKGLPRDVDPGNKIPIVSENRDKRDAGEKKIDRLVAEGAKVEEIEAQDWDSITEEVSNA